MSSVFPTSKVSPEEIIKQNDTVYQEHEETIGGGFGFEQNEVEEIDPDEIGVDPDDPRVMLDDLLIIDENDDYDAIALFQYGVNYGCSDIHLTPGSPPKLRIKGDLYPIEGLRPLTGEDVDWVRQQTMEATDQGEFMQRIYSHVYAYDIPGVGRFRMIVSKVIGGLSIIGRLLVDNPPTFDELNTNYAIRDLANFNAGLILVSGITGSGKSTLMAAMIQSINTNRYCKIISLEDPVEIIHKPINADVLQRGIGAELESFSDGIRDAMRQDPDVILIGEIRDKETAQAALNAAMSGHLVISTVHAMSATASIGRMLDLFEGDDTKSARNRFAEVLRGIVSQKLVKRVDKNLTAVNEILLNTAELKKALEADAEPSVFRNILESSRHFGMQTFEDHLLQQLHEGAITEKIAIAQATDPEQMKEMIQNYNETGQLTISSSTTSPAEFTSTPHNSSEEVAEDTSKPQQAQSFSEKMLQEEEETGMVKVRSGAAPVRPQVFRPGR